eukprot:COSAG02_NODE_197_length_29578_cov_9.718647_8_plen_45_part_00
MHLYICVVYFEDVYAATLDNAGALSSLALDYLGSGLRSFLLELE